MTPDLQAFIANSRIYTHDFQLRYNPQEVGQAAWMSYIGLLTDCGSPSDVCIRRKTDTHGEDSETIDAEWVDLARDVVRRWNALPVALDHIERLAARVEELEIDNALQAAITMGAKLAVREQKVAQSPPETPKPRDICDEWAEAFMDADDETRYGDTFRRLGLLEMQAVVEAARKLRGFGMPSELRIALDALEAVKP